METLEVKSAVVELKLSAVEDRTMAHFTVIELSGIADEHTLPELRACCLTAIREGRNDFLIDLAGALKVSSRVFNLFGDLARKVSHADGQVLFTGMNESICERLASIKQDHPDITLILDEMDHPRRFSDDHNLRCF